MATDIFSSLYAKKDPFQEALARQAFDTSPISSPYQGLSRMAFALLAGKGMGDREREEQEVGQSVLDQPGLEGVAPQAMPKKGFSLSNLIPDFLKPSGGGGAEPASIRYNNPGAQYPGPSASAFGSTSYGTIGGGHKIAAFNSPEEGAAAQFHLLGRKYAGKPLSNIIAEWSGNNSSPSYIASVSRSLGIAPNTVITPEFVRSPEGIKLAQAMATFEAGKPFPLSPEGWQKAQQMAFGSGNAEMPANAQLAQGQATTGPQTRGRPTIPIEVQQQIARMVKTGNPALIQQATQLYNQYAAPKETWEPLVDPAQRAAAGIPATDQNNYQINSLTKQVKPVNPQPFAVNLQNQNESEFSKAYGKGQAERALKLEDAGNKANINFQRASLLQKMLGDIQTGKITPAVGTVGAWMQSVGLNPEAVGIDPKLPMTVEAMRGLSNEMVVGKIGASEGGFPANNFSDADRSFLQDTVLKLSDRPEANHIKLEVAKRVAKLEADKADAWADARDNGVSFEKFEREWRKEARKKDVFGDLYEEAKKLSTAPARGAPDKDALKKKYGLE